MTNIVKNRDYISRAELAGFVMDEFSQFASVRTTLHQQMASKRLPGLTVSDYEYNPVFRS